MQAQVREKAVASALEPNLAVAVLSDEVHDLLLGTLIIAVVITFVALAQFHAVDSRGKAMRRSRSCRALLDLQNERVLAAACDMMAAFDERPRSPVTRLSRVQSLPTVMEALNDNKDEFLSPVPAFTKPLAQPATPLQSQPASSPNLETYNSPRTPCIASQLHRRVRSLPPLLLAEACYAECEKRARKPGMPLEELDTNAPMIRDTQLDCHTDCQPECQPESASGSDGSDDDLPTGT
mmetsp:Transcript_46632/g.122449  ORF Transcript_46632/g.122449 Transcript_46632/m.122449 type:complete len:237 (+) Transcript_46632:60-770(+)